VPALKKSQRHAALWPLEERRQNYRHGKKEDREEGEAFLLQRRWKKKGLTSEPEKRENEFKSTILIRREERKRGKMLSS